MRDTLVDGQLQHLGIDHDETYVLRRCVVQQADDHPVDRDRFARACGTGHQQMGHLRQIDGHGSALDVLAKRDLKLGGRLGEAIILQDLTEVDHLARLVRYLDADHRFTGYGRQDAHRLRLQGHRQVLLEVGDLARPGSRLGGEFEHRDDRPHVDLFDLAANAVVGHRLLQSLGHLVETLLVGLVPLRRQVLK